MDTLLTIATTRGAAKAVAQALGISQAAVSQWRGSGVPAERRDDVERALRAYLEDLAARVQAGGGR
jgi:DNA-binding transcriptional regulator YdaS (Cro superfamily)